MHDVVFCEQARDGIVGDDAWPRLYKDILHRGEAQKLLGVGLGQARGLGNIGESGLAADGEAVCEAEASDTLLGDELVVLYVCSRMLGPHD